MATRGGRPRGGGGGGHGGPTLGDYFKDQVGDLEKLDAGARTLGESISSTVDKAGELSVRLAEVGAAATVAFAVHGVVALNAELENTQIALGAIFQAQGYYSSFEAGFARAGDEVAKMKRDVMQLPVTFGELRETMQMIATPASHAGANIDQIRQLAERTTLVAGILGVQQDLAAREMGQLLSGHMNARNRLGIELGFEAKTFNAQTHVQQLAEITANFARFDDSADRFSQSFKTNATSLKDNLINFNAAATSGLFEHVKVTLAEANTWFDTHREKVAELASLVDRRLSGAWVTIETTVKSISREIGPWLDQLVHMQPAAMMQKLETAGEVGIGLKAGGMLLKGGLGMAGGAAGGEAAAGLSLLAAPALLSTAAALSVLHDKTSSVHDQSVKLAEHLGGQLVQSMQEAGHAARGVDVFWHQLGFLTLNVVDGAVTGLHKLESAIIGLGESTGPAFSTFWRHLTTAHAFQAEDDASLKRFKESVDTPGAIQDHIADFIRTPGVHRPDPDVEKKLKSVPSANAIVKVEIVVKGSDDPSRVARLTVEHLAKIARNPTRSPYVPDFSSPHLR